jgi:hypothetical protein
MPHIDPQPRTLLTHEDIDRFYELASQSANIINFAGDMVRDLHQSMIDDEEFWGASASLTGGQ